MVEESLLTPEARALIGRESAPQTVRVTRRGVERGHETYYGTPLKFEGKPGDDVPGYAISALDYDSSSGDDIAFPPLLPNSLLISNEWVFERPLRLDEELVSVRRLADVTERFGGQFGYALNVRTESVYRDKDGNTVATAVNTLMQYDVSNARKETES